MKPTPQTSSDDRPVIIIEPTSGSLRRELTELLRAYRLFFFFTARDIRIRYKQTFLGIAWALVQPLGTVVALTFVFSYLAKLDTGETSYPLFSITGLVPWAFFAATANRGAHSLLSNGHLLSRIYFPRLILPLSAGGAPAIDALVALFIALTMMLYTGVPPGITALLAPLFLLGAGFIGVAVGIVLSAAVVKVRDVRNVLPLGFQLWMFMTPVAYATSMVPDQFGWIMALNPLAPVVEAFRAALLGGAIPWIGLASSATFTLGLLVVGLWIFHRAASRFADIW